MLGDSSKVWKAINEVFKSAVYYIRRSPIFNWGKQRMVYHAIIDWNTLNKDIRSSLNIVIFEHKLLNYFNNLMNTSCMWGDRIIWCVSGTWDFIFMHATRTRVWQIVLRKYTYCIATLTSNFLCTAFSFRSFR